MLQMDWQAQHTSHNSGQKDILDKQQKLGTEWGLILSLTGTDCLPVVCTAPLFQAFISYDIQRT